MRTLLLFALASVAAVAHGVEVIGTVEHDALDEVSGLVKSERGDFYWVHNDSGDSARLFAIDAAGTPLVPPWMGVATEDWPGHAIDHAAQHGLGGHRAG